MNVLNEFFKTVLFYKVDAKDDFAIYAAEISNLTSDGNKKYVILFVPHHLAQKDKAMIFDLPWRSLQMRSIKAQYRCGKPVLWKYPRDLPDPMMTVRDRQDSHSIY